jgi:hypothetical protein
MQGEGQIGSFLCGPVGDREKLFRSAAAAFAAALGKPVPLGPSTKIDMPARSSHARRRHHD